MARPRKEGMDYFPHDTDASSDEKIDAMRALFGNDGYTFYFILCERIYRTSNAELDISKPVLLAPIVKKLLVSKDLFNEMLEAAFELNLFDPIAHSQRKVVTSNGIKKRFREVSQMRNRWRKQKENQSSDDVFHEENHEENSQENNAELSSEKDKENTEETRESKAKQSKVNEINSSGSGIGEMNIFKLFESEGFGTISSMIADTLGDLEDTYGNRWTVEAMKEAVIQGKRSLSYVNGILKRWKAEGIDNPWEAGKEGGDSNGKLKGLTSDAKNGRSNPQQHGSYGRGSQPSREKPQMSTPGPAKEITPEEQEEMLALARKLDEKLK